VWFPVNETAISIGTVRRRSDNLAEALSRIELRLAEMSSQLDRLGGEIEPLRRILRALAAEDAANRRRLVQARSRPDYELAFTKPEPLVSIVIPSHDRAELLRTRSVL
jgi:hypothetical protein